VASATLYHRNGYRARAWATRAGELELAIPKLRRRSYFPSFLEPRRRSEQALVLVVQEAYAAGVSTRKVDQVVAALTTGWSTYGAKRSQLVATAGRWGRRRHGSGGESHCRRLRLVAVGTP
jgi:transposase-like protein